MTTLIIYILFLHWIGDFICQTDWMAQNKSKDWTALNIHVLVYFFVLLLGTLPFYFQLTDSWGKWFGGYASLNFPLHFATDAITSRITAKLYNKSRHWFFVVIGLDQFIHAATLILTLPK